MKINVKKISIVCSILAFLICLAGGLWILINVGPKKDDAIWFGMGLYFVGKAFFVGPMLLMAALQYE